MEAEIHVRIHQGKLRVWGRIHKTKTASLKSWDKAPKEKPVKVDAVQTNLLNDNQNGWANRQGNSRWENGRWRRINGRNFCRNTGIYIKKSSDKFALQKCINNRKGGVMPEAMSLLHAAVLGMTMIDAERARRAEECPECSQPLTNGRCHKCDQAGQ